MINRDHGTTHTQATRYECDDPAHLSESSVGGLVDYDDYLAIVAERDEWRDAAKWAEHQYQYWKQVAEVVSAAGVRLQQSLQHDPTFAAMVKKFEIPVSRSIIAQTPEADQ